MYFSEDEVKALEMTEEEFLTLENQEENDDFEDNGDYDTAFAEDLED